MVRASEHYHNRSHLHHSQKVGCLLFEPRHHPTKLLQFVEITLDQVPLLIQMLVIRDRFLATFAGGNHHLGIDRFDKLPVRIRVISPIAHHNIRAVIIDQIEELFGVGFLSRSQFQNQGFAQWIQADMDFCGESASTSAQTLLILAAATIGFFLALAAHGCARMTVESTINHSMSESRSASMRLAKTLFDPAIKPSPDRIGLAESFGEVGPRRAGANDPKDGINEESIVHGNAAMLSGPTGKKVFDPIPIVVRNFVATMHGKSSKVGNILIILGFTSSCPQNLGLRVNGNYDFIFANSGAPITTNGVFYTFDVMVTGIGSGEVAFDGAAATDDNLTAPSPLMLTTGPALNVRSVPEPHSFLLCGGTVGLLALLRKRINANQST